MQDTNDNPNPVVIRLERGVWYTAKTDNHRTLVRENATRFDSVESARRAMGRLVKEIGPGRYPEPVIGSVGSKRAYWDLEPS